MSNDQWYYERSGSSFGPIAENEIIGMVKSGVLKQNNLVWKQGFSGWISLDRTELNNFINTDSLPSLSIIDKSNTSDKIASVVAAYIVNSEIPKKDIVAGNQITEEVLNKLTYAVLQPDEIPLIVINGNKTLYNMGKTGLIITNKRIYYKVIERSFFASITQTFTKPIIGVFDFDKIIHFQIGEHDACLGTAYVGHDLEINQKTIGLIRMGGGIFYNGKLLKFVNGLSEQMVKEGILKIPPREYAWQ
jgi:hypothetical protein